MAAAWGVKKKILVNIDFGLGNKLMVGTVNANREYFEKGTTVMAVAEAEYPGGLKELAPGQRAGQLS